MSRTPTVRKGQGDADVDLARFRARFLARFVDPAYQPLRAELERLIAVAWEAYQDGRKAPHTRPAGDGFADPGYELSLDWLATRAAIQAADARHRDPSSPTRILVVNGSPRHEATCPGEVSKSFRLAGLAREEIEAAGAVCDLLDLSLLTAEYGRVIYPCKACVSTAMPLCHWPCSCYPNHSLGQVDDWMNEIYPRWVDAHGVLIVTPVHWYQAPGALKLMIDRLVCADGGNPDPTRTGGKDAARAKALELDGWDYPRHLAGRVFGVVVHGDVDGVETLRRSLVDWLEEMTLIHAGRVAEVGRYVGYYESYAESHEALDRDGALQLEVRHAARALVEAVTRRRAGGVLEAGRDLPDPRPK